MIESRPKTPLAAYIKAQELVNLCHKNGSIELSEEFDLALDYAEQLEAAHGEPQSVLIVGCRTGYEVRAFAGYFPFTYVVGLDIVEGFLKLGSKRGAHNLVQADMHALPFKPQSFDWVFSTGTLEHAYDPQKVVDELCRVGSKLVYCTADIAIDRSNKSHWSFSADTSDWLGLFPKDWKTEGIVRDASIHVTATRG